MGFSIDNYITVPGFAIIDLGLSGNELLCYSLIYGFTQDSETEFTGSLNYVSSALNITKQNAKKVIDRLIERGLLEKKEIYFSGVKFCHYVAKRHGVAEIATGCYRNSNGGVVETVTHNIQDNNRDITIQKEREIEKENSLFGIVEESPIKQKGTTEPLCLFANSRYANFDKFAACFMSPDYANVDIAYYHKSVADWSASSGKKKQDWIATARNFMRKDAEDHKLHILSQDGFDMEAAMRYLNM